MLLISVADVEVKYRTIEAPEACPMCGARLTMQGNGRFVPVRA